LNHKDTETPNRLKEGKTLTRRSIRILIVEGAGCGGCALEAQSALTKRYGAAERGIRAVETSPHADILVVCGPTPMPLAEEVQRLEEGLALPRKRVGLGDCAQGEESEIVVPGCPPSPEAILAAIEAAWKTGPHTESPPDQEEPR
jgi:Ni,Fe-hydrogenase III small subunit